MWRQFVAALDRVDVNVVLIKTLTLHLLLLLLDPTDDGSGDDCGLWRLFHGVVTNAVDDTTAIAAGVAIVDFIDTFYARKGSRRRFKEWTAVRKRSECFLFLCSISLFASLSISSCLTLCLTLCLTPCLTLNLCNSLSQSNPFPFCSFVAVSSPAKWSDTNSVRLWLWRAHNRVSLKLRNVPGVDLAGRFTIAMFMFIRRAYVRIRKQTGCNANVAVDAMFYSTRAL
jgi:hypothetical protein